jgi:hypothetical protein
MLQPFYQKRHPQYAHIGKQKDCLADGLTDRQTGRQAEVTLFCFIKTNNKQ